MPLTFSLLVLYDFFQKKGGIVKKKKVLLVDHWRNLEDIVSKFPMDKFDVRTARNNFDAKNSVAKHGVPDIVVTALMLEEGYDDGVRLITHLRGRYPRLKIIAWTASLNEVRDIALHAGANVAISKQTDSLLDAIEALLSANMVSV